MAGTIGEMAQTLASEIALANEIEINEAGTTKKVTIQKMLDAIDLLANAGSLADADKMMISTYLDFPEILSVTVSSFSTDTTDHQVSMPAAVIKGDLLLMVFVNDDISDITTPGGWSQSFTTINSTTVRLTFLLKKAGGTEGGTTVNVVTTAAQTAVAQVYRIKVGTWRDSGSILNDVEAGTATGSSTTPDPPDDNPAAWDIENTLWLAFFGEDNLYSSAENITGPASYTDLIASKSGSGSLQCSMGSARRNLAAASENPGTFTHSDGAQDWIAVNIQVRPAQGVKTEDLLATKSFFANAASQAEQEAGSEAAKIVTPAAQHYHPSASKFWVKWTGNSTTMLASYNMTSIADTAVGDADGTINTDFSGANWCGRVSTLDATNGWDNEEVQNSGFNAQAAGTFGVLCSTITDGNTAVCSLTDPDSWHVVGYGDL